MFHLDEQYLADLGLAGLSEDVKKPLVEGIEQQIQDRISLRMAEGLTDEQLDHFADLTESEDPSKEAVQLKWLEQNVPNYQEIIIDVLKEVKEEILAQKAQVLGN